MRFFAFLISTVLSFNVIARNDWYEVQNYKGFVGVYPIELSVQTYNFGSGVNIKGSYFYNKTMTPIALYGKVVNNEIIICETHGAKDYESHIVDGVMFEPEKCEFKLLKSNNDLIGSWSNKRNRYNVKLIAADSWINGVLTGESLRIPFWGSDGDYSFIGIYKARSGILTIDEINVIEKTNVKVIQAINPQSDKCDFGFYMTAIYQNLERDLGGLYLNCYSTKGDVISELKYIKEINKYVINQ
jgi:hypothetical protein